MSQPKYFEIDPKYYVGRSFNPVQNEEIDMAGHPYPIQSSIGPNGAMCIRFKATGPLGSTIKLSSTSPYPTPPNVSQERIVSITKTPLDFSNNVRHGVDVSIDAMIGPYVRPGLYVELEAGEDYYINVANAKVDAVGPEFRAQVSPYIKA